MRRSGIYFQHLRAFHGRDISFRSLTLFLKCFKNNDDNVYAFRDLICGLFFLEFLMRRKWRQTVKGMTAYPSPLHPHVRYAPSAGFLFTSLDRTVPEPVAYIRAGLVVGVGELRD